MNIFNLDKAKRISIRWHSETKTELSTIIEMIKVPRLGGKSFEQVAGLLRIKNAKNPLDDSAVHLESSGLVNRMAKDVRKNIRFNWH